MSPAEATAVGLILTALVFVVLEVQKMRRDARDIHAYRLSRARAAATHYRNAVIMVAESTGSMVDPDTVAAMVAAFDGDDFTADELRAQTLTPAPTGNPETETA